MGEHMVNKLFLYPIFLLVIPISSFALSRGEITMLCQYNTKFEIYSAKAAAARFNGDDAGYASSRVKAKENAMYLHYDRDLADEVIASDLNAISNNNNNIITLSSFDDHGLAFAALAQGCIDEPSKYIRNYPEATKLSGKKDDGKLSTPSRPQTVDEMAKSIDEQRRMSSPVSN